ncbi:MAG: hybrid sensor histidine kinase/response regulator [Desulfomonilia bacterium]
MKDLWSEQDTSAELSSSREKILLDLLAKATDFYEDTIGILSSIFEFTECVRRGSPEREFYATVVKVLIEESRCENASIFLVEGDEVVLKAAAGSHTGEVNDRVFMKLGDGVAGRCAMEGRSILVTDTGECNFFKEISRTKVIIGSMLCVPIMESSRTIGVINLSHSQKDFFSIHYVRVFELLGLLLGQMFTLIHLYDLFQRNNTGLRELLDEKDQSLRDITERYKTIVDASDDMILVMDNDRLVFINHALKKMREKPPASLDDVFDHESKEQLLSHALSLEPGQTREFEMNLTIADSTGKIVQVFLKRMEADQVVVIIRDITTKRKIEQKTMQTEKLTSLGLLTSGIAHELNNKLTPILGFADLIDAASLDEQDRKRLSIVVNSANAAKNIVESLLIFSRNKPPEKSVFDLREVIGRAVNLYTPIIKKRGIMIVHEDTQEPLLVRADMNCIEQVLVNFINNSIDSIGEHQGTIWIRSFLRDEFVQVSIEDTGPGIPDEIMTKIFDPFFTTKPKDKGTGLGLSICHGIICDHKGEIFLENTRNGAMATFRIPAVVQGEERVQPTQPDLIAPSGREEYVEVQAVIMVVEDEEDLMDLMVDTLSPDYTVKTFANGQMACDHLHEYPWGLIISDLRMPVMDGMELYREAIKKYPDLKGRFMFITGDTYDFQVKEFLEDTGVAYLRKPFRINELRDVVRKKVQCRVLAE